MFDIWGFLLQTLTASGVAVLLLIIKALFRDKLPPKWHFAVWRALGIALLIPAGFNGRYVLFHWQLVVEIIKSWCADYSFTRVLFPIPVLTHIPQTIIEWIFAGYTLGVVVHIVRYLVSYIRLRSVLRNGNEPRSEIMSRIHQIATAQKVKPCRVIAVPGLPSAFVCGIIRPILVIPSDKDVDDKVILHELLHLKYKDTLWSVVICLLRCIHWCNPCLIYCANQATNDMEARCDQYVLEQLEGEERRDYGRILLSMSNDRFAKTYCSTCVNNGGKNIRDRIEAIARFKKYPAGMGLVSGCVIILLILSLVVGVQATEVYDRGNSIQLSMASARSTPCTTPAGAFDSYGKAILEQNGIYRAMCAPESIQAHLVNELSENNKSGIFPGWDAGLPAWPNTQSGYYVYNLKQSGKNAYEGLFVVELNYPPEGQAENEEMMYLAVQNLRVEKENGRWVAIPLEEFRAIEALHTSLAWGCLELPGMTYTGITSDIRVEVKVQTIHMIDNSVQSANNNFFFGTSSYYDTTPKPNAEFSTAARTQQTSCTHLGTETDRDIITQIGLSVAPVYPGEERPEFLSTAAGDYSSGSNSHGEVWISQKTEPGWGPTIEMGGGGSGIEPDMNIELPQYYAADLYLNNELVANMDLYLQEGGTE